MEKILFDEDWKFLRKNLPPYHPADRWGGAKAGAYDFGAVSDNCDENDWENVTLPHDYVRLEEYTTKVSQSEEITDIPAMQSIQSRLHAGGCLEPKVAWYRKHFKLEEAWKNRPVYLKFDGVYRDCDVYLNQMYVGSYTSGYTYFYFEITDFLREGENILSVRVNPTGREGWWYEGGGIYRHVWLEIQDELLIEPHKLGAVATADYKKRQGKVMVSAEITSRIMESRNALLKSVIYDEEGNEVSTETTPFTINAWGERRIEQELEVSGEQLRLWELESPYLYRIKSWILHENGKEIISEQPEQFIGFKETVFTPEKGFFLNGKSVKLKGLCVHHDHAGVGIGMPDSVVEYRLREMKKMGMNALRSAHHQPSDVLLELCDKLGILVFSETRRMSSAEEDLEQLRRVVRQGRNHACVFLWGIGNEEINIQHKKETIKTTKRMEMEIRKLDSVHPFTAAVVCWDGKEHFKDARRYFDVTKHLDVMGFNYCISAWDDYHENNPEQPVLVTEINAANSSTRGIYETEEGRGHFFTLDNKNVEKCTNKERAAARKEIGEKEWKAVAERSYLAGGFLWTGIDYRGEPTPMPWPAIGSSFGIMDYCGFPKDSFYYYRSWWGEKAVLHLFPHWNHAGREGQKLTVYAYTNADAVELFVNGKSYGVKEVEENWYLTWENVVYEPGELKAVGKKNGEIIEKSILTTGAPERVEVLKYTENQFTFDKVAIFNIRVLDKDNQLVPDACPLLHITMEQGTRLLGIGNGDPGCHEHEQSTTHHAFNGLMQVIVAYDKTPGIKVSMNQREGKESE